MSPRHRGKDLPAGNDRDPVHIEVGRGVAAGQNLRPRIGGQAGWGSGVPGRFRGGSDAAGGGREHRQPPDQHNDKTNPTRPVHRTLPPATKDTLGASSFPLGGNGRRTRTVCNRTPGFSSGEKDALFILNIEKESPFCPFPSLWYNGKSRWAVLPAPVAGERAAFACSVGGKEVCRKNLRDRPVETPQGGVRTCAGPFSLS